MQRYKSESPKKRSTCLCRRAIVPRVWTDIRKILSRLKIHSQTRLTKKLERYEPKSRITADSQLIVKNYG